MEQLGSGQFGEVCKALWSLSGGTKELAIKTLRTELPEEEKVRFLQEAAIMGQFSHSNVIKLYGVVTIGDPVSTMSYMHACTLVILSKYLPYTYSIGYDLY